MDTKAKSSPTECLPPVVYVSPKSVCADCGVSTLWEERTARGKHRYFVNCPACGCGEYRMGAGNLGDTVLWLRVNGYEGEIR